MPEKRPRSEGRNKEEVTSKLPKCQSKVCILQPGLVLMKNYLSVENQKEFVQTIMQKKDLFYQPSYMVFGKMGKLHYNYQCLGLHWNPETKKSSQKYSKRRMVDGKMVEEIPPEWISLCDTIMAEEEVQKQSIPHATPQSVLINWYQKGGKLGFHQDKDESSNNAVISISLGSPAEFQYFNVGEKQQDSKSIFLESGDVLIFGGESRMIYHCIKRIAVNLDTPDLGFDGRLNLTFRHVK